MPGWLLIPKEGLPKDPRPGHKGELVSSGLQRQGRVGEPPQSSRDAESEPPPALAAQPALLQPVLQFSSPLLCPFPLWAQTRELFLLLCSRFTPLSTQAAPWVPGTWQAPAGLETAVRYQALHMQRKRPPALRPASPPALSRGLRHAGALQG